MSQKLVSYARTHYRVILDVPSNSPLPSTSTLLALLETQYPQAVVYVTPMNLTTEASHV